MIKVYYWKVFEPKYLLEHIPTAEEFARDYALVWQGDIPRGKYAGLVPLLEGFFQRFNDYMTNPLAVEGGGAEAQRKLRELGVGHTSMSVGDVVQVKGAKWICAAAGWKRLESEQKAQATALAAHVVTRDFESNCKHPVVRDERCTRCLRRVVRRPRLTR